MSQSGARFVRMCVKAHCALQLWQCGGQLMPMPRLRYDLWINWTIARSQLWSWFVIFWKSITCIKAQRALSKQSITNILIGRFVGFVSEIKWQFELWKIWYLVCSYQILLAKVYTSVRSKNYASQNGRKRNAENPKCIQRNEWCLLLCSQNPLTHTHTQWTQTIIIYVWVKSFVQIG